MVDHQTDPGRWHERLAPDLSATLRRFPFAIALAALATLALLAVLNTWVDKVDETWPRLATGLATGAIFAAAGHLFSESRPRATVTGFALTYLLPVVVVAVLQVRSSVWLVPYALPAISILWLSVSAVTSFGAGKEREAQQNRFWWFNHRAFTTAAIAAIALVLISVGTLAIERALAALFGLSTDRLFYYFLLPVVGGLAMPVYWLATLPHLDDYDIRELSTPDFLARAIGFLGQFVLTPLLLAYGLILLAYAAQIVATQRLPAGTIGWIVLGFAVTGAANWLLLHPAFMRDRMVVRFFRRWWFWLTVPPLILYAVAVLVRIDAYGLTPGRLVLVWGGLWAAVLALFYLLRAGDIRLIPALAAIALVLMSFGPWNLENLPRLHQGMLLDALLYGRNADPSVSIPAQPVWTEEEQARARGAIEYLHRAYRYSGAENRAELARVLRNAGHDHGLEIESPDAIMADLGYPDAAGFDFRLYRLSAAPGIVVDVSATPFMLGRLAAHDTPVRALHGVVVRLEGGGMQVVRDDVVVFRRDLSDWAAAQGTSGMAEPWLDFVIGGVSYRLALDTATMDNGPDGPDGPIAVSYLSGVLFASAAMPTP